MLNICTKKILIFLSTISKINFYYTIFTIANCINGNVFQEGKTI